MLKISPFERPTSLGNIHKFESEYCISLPESYKVFLLKNNGGIPSNKCFDFLIKDGSYTDSVIERFLSLCDDCDCSLEDTYKRFLEIDPVDSKYMLPIAQDPGGNFVCIAVNNDANGVYFWDHEAPGQLHLHLISDSFDQFLNDLHADLENLDAIVDRSIAIAKSDLISIGKYIKQHGLENKSVAGFTLLEDAVVNNKVVVAEYLIKSGAKLNRSFDLAERANKMLGGRDEMLNLLTKYKNLN